MLFNDIRYSHKEQLVKGDDGNVKCVYSDFISDVLNVGHSLCQTADRMSAKKGDHMKYFYSTKVWENSQQLPSRNFNTLWSKRFNFSSKIRLPRYDASVGVTTAWSWSWSVFVAKD